MTSTIKTDELTTKSDDTDLTITGQGTGVPNIEAGFKVGGSAGVPTASIQDDAITSAKIADDAVGTAAIADDAITSALIADDAITSALIADDAVGSAAIADNAVTTALINDDAVTLAKMASGTDGVIITYDASGNPVHVGPGSDGQVLTSTGAGSPPAFENAAGGGIGEYTPTDGLSIAIGKTNTPLQNESGTSNHNIGIGEKALEDCTSSTHNVAIGTDSLKEVTSYTGYNTAVGVYACQNVTDGNNNTGMANSALYSCNTGDFNSAFGRSALLDTTTGSNNSGFGYNAHSSGATASNEITLGNSSVSSLRCQQTSISSLSDERDKAEITDLPEEAGLDLINALRPRTFYWDMREWYEDGVRDGSKIKRTQRSWQSNSGMRQGFIAQEVESAIAGMKCLEDSKVVSGTKDKKELGPAHLLVNAIKAIQQLSAENKELLARIKTLEDA